MSEAKIVALSGSFTNPKALLAHIAEDEDIESLIVVTFAKDDQGVGFAALNINRKTLAFASVMLAAKCLEEVEIT